MIAPRVWVGEPGYAASDSAGARAPVMPTPCSASVIVALSSTYFRARVQAVSLLGELKRRNRYRVACSPLVQVAASLEEVVKLPDWFDGVVVSLTRSVRYSALRR